MFEISKKKKTACYIHFFPQICSCDNLIQSIFNKVSQETFVVLFTLNINYNPLMFKNVSQTKCFETLGDIAHAK